MTRRSLLAGRNRNVLTKHDIRSVTNTFLGMEPGVAVKYDSDASTAFAVAYDDDGDQYGEIIFGPDIYPGNSVVDPNSALSMNAAVSHELTHYCRWRDKTQIDDIALMHLDEAITSLEAALRYGKHLSEHDQKQLIHDALQRLHMYMGTLKAD